MPRSPRIDEDALTEAIVALASEYGRYVLPANHGACCNVLAGR